MNTRRKRKTPSPGWWRSLTMLEFGRQFVEFNMTKYSWDDVALTNVLLENGVEVGRAGCVERVLPGCDLAFVATDGEPPVYCDLWRGVQVRSAHDDTRTLPQAGWWKSLAIAKFFEEIERFRRTPYYRDEVTFTHNIVRGTILDPLEQRLDVIGEAGCVENVFSGGPASFGIQIGFMQLCHLKHPIYCIISEWFDRSQLRLK